MDSYLSPPPYNVNIASLVELFDEVSDTQKLSVSCASDEFPCPSLSSLQSSSSSSQEYTACSYFANETNAKEIKCTSNSIPLEMTFLRPDDSYVNNQGKFAQLVKCHGQSDDQVLFIERGKSILVCLDLINVDCTLLEQLELVLLPWMVSSQCGPFMELFAHQGGSIKSLHRQASQTGGEAIIFPLHDTVLTSPEEHLTRCIFGIKFCHLTSKFASLNKRPLRVTLRIQPRYNAAVVTGNCSIHLAERRFQVVCCASPARDAQRFTERKLGSIEQIAFIPTLGQLLHSNKTNHQLARKREYQQHYAQPESASLGPKNSSASTPVEIVESFDLDNGGTLDVDADSLSSASTSNPGEKRRYTISTSDFGIYCVLQRMANEMIHYRQQLQSQMSQQGQCKRAKF